MTQEEYERRAAENRNILAGNMTSYDPSQVSQWMNPAIQSGLNKIQEQMNSQFAGAGTMNSGARMRAMNDATGQMMLDQWNQAANQAQVAAGIKNQNAQTLAGMDSTTLDNIYNTDAQKEMNAAALAAQAKANQVPWYVSAIQGVGALGQLGSGIGAVASGFGGSKKT